MVIRKMTVNDLDDVMEIEHQCFSVPWTKDAFLMEIEKNKFARYFVVEVDGMVAAYGGMWMIIDEAHITNIAVRHGHRGKGYGKGIVEALIEAAEKENIYRMTLEVRRSNIAAQRLYEQYGFACCGFRPRYYEDNQEDAMIMWRE
ncbi:MAG: ribosomal protein S18-alanine N-acetyltransferase [Bacillota bacterium]